MTEIKLEVDALLVCRICLQESDDEMISIFDRDTSENLYIYEKIENCGGIKILSDPELPTRVCKKCQAFLTIAHKFQIICKNSDNYLREFVCKPTKTQSVDDEGDGMPEYLLEYCPEVRKASAVEVLQNAGHELSELEDNLESQEIKNYDELWVKEKEEDEDEYDVIEEDQDESFDFSPSPSKTLGISPDGTAVIRIKSEPQLNNKEKQIHICEICGNSYPRKYALDAHMRRHRNERPFECEICGQSFHLNFQLTRHIRKHTGARPFLCQYCNRNFADRSSMVKHERIHRNERPYKCGTCGKNFTYSSVLKVHMLTHTGEKPFICGICGKRFARSHHLRAHLETLLHQSDPRSKVLLTQIKRDEEQLKISNEEFIEIV